jgi:hypothetical protein
MSEVQAEVQANVEKVNAILNEWEKNIGTWWFGMEIPEGRTDMVYPQR